MSVDNVSSEPDGFIMMARICLPRSWSSRGSRYVAAAAAATIAGLGEVAAGGTLFPLDDDGKGGGGGGGGGGAPGSREVPLAGAGGAAAD